MQKKKSFAISFNSKKVCVFIYVVTFPDLNLESSCIYKLNSVNCLACDIARVDSACLEHM